MKYSSKLDVCPLRSEQISKAVTIHQAAFPGFFLTFLGPAFLKLLYHFYVQGKTEIALAGEYNGQIVATLLGTIRPQGFYKRLAICHFTLFAMACFMPLLRQPTIFPRLLRALFYRGDAPLSATGGALLASVCVDPMFKKKGTGKKLVLAFENKCFEMGAQFVYLTTDRNNNKAVHEFYERLGWSVESEFTTPQGRSMCRYWKKISQPVIQ
jgi:GNAT superfamily N-acetyltransferase